MLGKNNVRRLISENYPFISILVGTILVSLSVGPYQNLDSQVEFEAASGVIQWGFPFVKVAGNFINEPPLGFYSEALFFKAFGSSIALGVILVTLFGIGSTILVYKIGKEVYGKPTGLFTAALFGLTPWQLVLSRSFLIDAECLLLSLFCFYFAILAIRKNSVKLSAVSGAFFTGAFLTKFYAAFMLIPLLILWVYYRPKNQRRMIAQFIAFSVLPLIFVLFWYQVVVGKFLPSIFNHSDFSDLNPSDVNPTYSFVVTFLVRYGLGYVFVGATIFSFVFSFLFRRYFTKTLIFDLTALVTIVVVLGVNTILGAGLNLKVPYNSAIKYDYQTLPFFCLIVSSLVGKSFSLLSIVKSRISQNGKMLFSVGVIGIVMIVLVVLVSFSYAHQLSLTGFLIFRMKMNENVGYSLFNYSLLSPNSFQFNLQYFGFTFVLLGIVWAGRNKLYDLFCWTIRPMRDWIEEKNFTNKKR